MPYFYLYDSYLQDKSYVNQLIRLETTLTDLGLQGKIGRLTLLKSIRDLIESALRDNTDTVVVVGNDITLSQAAEIVAPYHKVTLGFIPLGQDKQTLATLLGIPLGLLACHTLSSRIVERINLGKINNQFFLRSVTTYGLFNLTCENRYQLKVKSRHYLKICNFDVWGQKDTDISNPQDNLLEAILVPDKTKSWWPFFAKTRPPQPSLLPLKNIYLEAIGNPLLVAVDEYKVVKTPATITVAAERLKIISGRKRLF